jgi:WD40 repeat protein
MLLVKGLIESVPSEEVLLTGSGDGAVKLWRIGQQPGAAPSQIAKLQNEDPVLSIAVEGSLLYCGLAGGALNIWNLDSQQLVKRIVRHTGDLWAVHVIQGVAICGDSTGTVKVCRTLYVTFVCAPADPFRNSTPDSRKLVAGSPTKAPCLHLLPAEPRIDTSMQQEAMTTQLAFGT